MHSCALSLCLHGQRRWNRRLWRRLARALKAVAGRQGARPLALGVSILPELPGAPRGGARAKLVTANSTLNRVALQKQVVVLPEAQQRDPLRRDGRRGEAPHQAAAHQRRRQQALERTSRLDHGQVPRQGALLAPEGEACTQRRRAGNLDFAPTSIESQYTLQRTPPRAPLSHGGLRDEGAAGPPSAAVPLEYYTFRGPSCRYAA